MLVKLSRSHDTRGFKGPDEFPGYYRRLQTARVDERLSGGCRDQPRAEKDRTGKVRPLFLRAEVKVRIVERAGKNSFVIYRRLRIRSRKSHRTERVLAHKEGASKWHRQ